MCFCLCCVIDDICEGLIYGFKIKMKMQYLEALKSADGILFLCLARTILG